MKKLLENKIQVIDCIENWEKAVELAAQPLIEKNSIKKGYVDNAIKNIKDLGPYVIIVPGVAMPHARPDENVLESSLAFLKINKGVIFSEDKEKVKLIFVLAAKDSDSHIEIIEKLMNLLGDDEALKKLFEAEKLENIKKIIEKY